MQNFIITTLILFLFAIILARPIGLCWFNFYRKYILNLDNLNNRMESVTQEFLVDDICELENTYNIKLIINDTEQPDRYNIAVSKEAYLNNLIIGDIIPLKMTMLSIWYQSINVIFVKFQSFGEVDYFNIAEINKAKEIALLKIKKPFFIKSMRLILGAKGDFSQLTNEIKI